MIWFFRDFLSGPLYLLTSVISIIFIMAIIGFIMERKQLEQEKNNREAILKEEGVPASNLTSNLVVNEISSSDSSDLVSTSTGASVDSPINSFDGELEKKAENAATNDNIPTVLDLDSVEQK